jgi:transposase
MRKIKEVLRLKWSCGLSRRGIAKSCSVARSTVDEYVNRAASAGLSWPLPESLDDAVLEQLLYPPSVTPEASPRQIPDWHTLHRELSRRDVTLTLLWHEYKEQNPTGYQYSQFCELYKAYARKVDLSMRQPHRAGEKMFVDYCGRTVPIIETSTGEVREAQVFVAVLGASNFTYAEATWTQGLADWTGSHVRTMTFFGGVPEIIVPDNLKSGVLKTCRYEPELNPTYQDMASHYAVAVVPARVRKPKDKAKVEVAVQIVQRYILAALRNRTFFSLAQLNAAIRELLDKLNNRPFKKLPGTRMSRFLELDKPALRPLPAIPYQFAQWKKARVAPDYHIELFGHYYSVPYQLVGRALDIRATESTVEGFHKGTRIASHVRSHAKGRYTTVKDHMPKSHRDYAEWTPERLVRWAGETGPATAELIASILQTRPHPQQGFRSCLGIISLVKRYGKDRVEAACKRALAIGGRSFKSVRSILENGLDQTPSLQPAQAILNLSHDNIRGSDYYAAH